MSEKHASPLDTTTELSHSTYSKIRQSTKSAQPALLVIDGPALGRQFRLAPGTFVIGRSRDADIAIVDEGISRRHALIQRKGDDISLIDEDSRNGVFVNKKRIDACSLKVGDRIRIGSSTVIKFSHLDPLEEKFQKKMYDAATRDSLTGIYNKRHFQETISTTFAFHRDTARRCRS